MVRSNGRRGLLLQFTGKPRSTVVRQRALDAGFQKFGETGDVYLMAPQRPTRFNADEMARILDGSVELMPRAKVASYPWTIDYTAPDLGKSASYQNLSDSNRLEFIGRNFRGEGVYKYPSGNRCRKVVDESGQSEYVQEPAAGRHPEFLRAAGERDLPAIASGLAQMAEHGTVGEADYMRIASAAAEARSGESGTAFPPDADASLRALFLKQIVDLTLEDDGSRENYHRSMRLAENSQSVVGTGDPGRATFEPSASLLIFLRRLLLPASEVEFSGGSRLALAAPLLRTRSRPRYQLYDLTAAAPDRVHERIINLLAGREVQGTSVLAVSGSAGSPATERTRTAVGRSYALEIVAELTSLVATGRHDQDSTTLFVVGERRPESSDGLPQAALRTFSVFSRDDLDRLHTEILRSRRRIRDWHKAVEHEVDRRESALADNNRQRPYVPLSQATRPFTMIPKSLDGAAARALRRVAGDHEGRGGVDRSVAESLGIEVEGLGSVLTAEQVDAVAMAESSRSRNRGFLLADQTGIGKGRSLAAMARQQIRANGRVLYLTENAEINIPDVWRDLAAVGAFREVRPAILAGKPVKLELPPTTGVRPGKTARPAVYSTLPAASRRQVFESGVWPPGCNLVLTNYSLFNRGADSPAWQWAETAPDEHTLLILDESHNAINPGSNTGKAVRRMIEMVGRSNVVFATATPLRNPNGADLYKPLLPDAEGGRLDRILGDLAPGGETAQESFTTMLGEDGTYLRRDHDLSNLEFEYRLPDDDRMRTYQDIMNRMTPVVELMIDASLKVGSLVGRAQSQQYQRLIRDGTDERTARARTNALYQYSGATGSPLVRLARVTINAIKVDQVVEEAVNELREGRKPLITFHSTGASLFNELATDSSQVPSIPLSLSDQVARVAESIFRIRMDDEVQDARDRDPEIRRMSGRLDALIADLPADLPASPVDALLEKLIGKGYTAGEISGRTLAYQEQRIVRRRATDRRSIVDGFNDGGIDVLIYNSAGATGGSYHAAPEFGDRRPRTLIEMETPVDIIKYIQSQGRGNRYGQVAKPRIVSVMTGLIPELRILQQRNRKLRALGASIDGNRSHPLLMDDVPDLLNKVGDQATAQILRTNPDLTRRLGFTEFLSTADSVEEGRIDWMSGDSGASKSLVDSISNKVLTRSLVLSAADQERLVELITLEFEAIIEELESRNANPLRPKEIPGEIEVHATSLYSGIETGEDDMETSAFFAPLYMSTATHHMNDEPITGEQLQQMVERSRIVSGMDGFAPHAARIESMLPTLLAHITPPGMDLNQALATPDRYFSLKDRHARLVRFMELLRQIRPGVALRIEGEEGGIQGLLRTVVKLTLPRDDHIHLPQAYRIQTVSPGDGSPEIHTVRRLLRLWPDKIQFVPGLSMGVNEQHLQEFAHQLSLGRRYPVQFLSGNLLAAITEAQTHRLGTMCLFSETGGGIRRGIVVNRAKIDLDRLPAIVPSARVAAALTAKFVKGDINQPVTAWIGKRELPGMMFRVFSVFRGRDRPPGYRVSFLARRSFLNANPRASECLAGMEYATLEVPEQSVRFMRYLDAMDGQDVHTDGLHRATVNDLTRTIEEHGGIPPDLDMRLFSPPPDTRATESAESPSHPRDSIEPQFQEL